MIDPQKYLQQQMAVLSRLPRSEGEEIYREAFDAARKAASAISPRYGADVENRVSAFVAAEAIRKIVASRYNYPKRRR